MQKVTLVILGGFAGAGKTTIAKKLSAVYSVPLVDTDELNDMVGKTFELDFKKASPHAHDIAWGLVKKYLANGVSVILDTNMCNDRTWSNVDSVRNAMPEIDTLPIILQCSLETHKKRIDHRGATNTEHLNLGGDAFEDIVHKYEYIESLQRDDIVRIDAERSPEEVYAAVVTRLQGVKGFGPAS